MRWISSALVAVALITAPALAQDRPSLALGFRVDTRPIALWEPISVYDADTFDVGAERIRVNNLDAPEIGERAECDIERALGERATAVARELLEGGARVTIYPERRRDRYGRVLARVDVNGADLAQTLINRGLARPWRGRSSDWCA